MSFPRLLVPQEITSILTLTSSNFANKGIFRSSQLHNNKEKKEGNLILESGNQMDELDITQNKSRTKLTELSWQIQEN